MTATPLVLTLVILSPGAAVFVREATGPCDVLAADSALSVDQGRIGPFPSSSPLSALRDICPDAIPRLGYGFESAWAALDLSIGEMQILAGQSWLNKAISDDPDTPQPEVDWSGAPSHWVIKGCGGRLPGGVSTCGTWGDLVAAMGTDGSATAEFGPVLVSLDSLSGFQFQLDVTDQVVGPIEVHQDLSRIPAGAKIVEVYVLPTRGGAG